MEKEVKLQATFNVDDLVEQLVDSALITEDDIFEFITKLEKEWQQYELLERLCEYFNKEKESYDKEEPE